MIFACSLPSLAQKRSAKQERIIVKDVPDEYKSRKKNITPHKRKKLQTKNFINRKKTLGDKLTKREKREIEKASGIDKLERKTIRKTKRKKIKEDKRLARAEKKLRRKHLSLQEPDVKKRMKKNLKKTKKEFISLQQKKRKASNPYTKKPSKQKSPSKARIQKEK